MEKRVLYGLVVMLMYLVGGGYSQGVVEWIRDKAEWEEILVKTEIHIGVMVTSPLCGAPCDIVNDQVARFVETYGDRIKFYKVNILETLFFALDYKILTVPTVIIFKEGTINIRFESLSDWSMFYELLVNSSIIDFPPDLSPAPAPAPSDSDPDADLPPPLQSGE
ncbi:hypothetical protein BRARA_H00156 [Brassica rapa]|uniref:Thioredoxin domain-containing protein n=2 Tax=Brassica TaxID=3705 RepID=A0A397Y6X9_BRACM|nr:hypothetical protein BRARA_H00156 [Brassica rapa]CAF2213706.1 unnamed protein product [Brassica napus]CDY47564.1 BnaC03g69070D [Brassica napus]